MTGNWKWRSFWLVVASASALAIGWFALQMWSPADGKLSSVEVAPDDLDVTSPEPAKAVNDNAAVSDKAADGYQGRIQAGSLSSASSILSQLVLAYGPQAVPEDADSLLYEAEVLRQTSTPADAIRSYILLVDKYPDTPQAKAADERISYLLGGRSDAEMDTIEAALPSVGELTDVDGITAVGQFYFKRAQDLAESNPEKAAPYLQAIYDIGWPVFQDDLDDDYKATLLDGYLQVADMLGKGEETRAAFVELADTIPASFTSWLISTEVMGSEPSMEFVQTEKGQAAVRKYYLDTANDSKDPAVSSAYYTKCRDVSWRMFMQQQPDIPRLDDVRYYLEAANALGVDERTAAIDSVEKWIENEPFSIKRWIARYELAMFIANNTPSEEESRKGFQHFVILADEAESGIAETAINDTSLDENLRGLLICMWGHAYAGTNRIDDARACYEWVLDYFTNETHAGSSAAYSLALMDQREHYDDPSKGIAALESFVDGHPGSFYSAEALMHVADLRVQTEEPELAKSTLERVEREYWDTSLGKKATVRRERMVQEELQSLDSSDPEVQ